MNPWPPQKAAVGGIYVHHLENHIASVEAYLVENYQAECFDDAKGSHASQSFIQDKEIKDIQDG